MSDRPFRARDRIIVHWEDGRTAKGRVICHNRRDKYGHAIIVLYETATGNEITESFKPDGRKYLSDRDKTYITHSD